MMSGLLWRLLVSWGVNAVVLGLTGLILTGVSFDHSAKVLIVAAAVFGILNTILKPILKLLTLPFAILTLGIVWFFVAMLMLWLTELIVDRFSIHGFWNYVWATLIVWAANIVLENLVFRDRNEGVPAHAWPRRRRTIPAGGVPERSNGAVLKTV